MSNIELNMVELPNYKGAVIIGLFLSHGGLSYASDNNNYPRLGFEQAFSKFFYVWLVYRVFSHYCYSFPRFRTRNYIQTSSVTFSTRSLPCLVEVFNAFYKDGEKVVP